MKTFGALIILLFLTSSNQSLAAGQCPSPMTGEVHILVKFIPGPRWSEFSKYVSGHLAVLTSGMKAGHIISAGPAMDDDGNLIGGYTRYSSGSKKEVEALVVKDPLIQNSVMTYETSIWLDCHL